MLIGELQINTLCIHLLRMFHYSAHFHSWHFLKHFPEINICLDLNVNALCFKAQMQFI